MAVSDILNMETDVRPFFGNDACDEHDALLRKIRKFTESQARRFVGHGIIQATYTNEYHRRFGNGGLIEAETIIDVIDSNVYVGSYDSMLDGHVLQLDNCYVRSITSIYEDASARFASTGGFAAATLLTAGSDYDLEMFNGTFSPSGRVIRRNRNWNSTPGTIKVTYVAGLSAAELNDEYVFVKAALLEDMRCKFDYQVSRRTSSGYTGPIRKETYHGDYTVEYGFSPNASSSAVMTDLTSEAKQQLQSIRRMSL